MTHAGGVCAALSDAAGPLTIHPVEGSAIWPQVCADGLAIYRWHFRQSGRPIPEVGRPGSSTAWMAAYGDCRHMLSAAECRRSVWIDDTGSDALSSSR